MGLSVSKWIRNEVAQYGIRDAQSFLANYHAISRDLYIKFGDCDDYNLDVCNREENLVKRVKEIACWRSAENVDKHGQINLFSSNAPSPSRDELFLARVMGETNSRGSVDVARLAEAVERCDWEWVVGRIWSYRRSTVADSMRMEHRIMVDDLPALTNEEGDKSADEDVVDAAEKLVHKNRYYEFCRDELSIVDDRVDASTLYRRYKGLFDEYNLDRTCVIKLIGYAKSLAMAKCCDVEDILGDARFQEFLQRVGVSLAVPVMGT